MVAPSRFTAVGMAGPSSGLNSRDYALQTFIVPIPRVASAAEQTTDFFFPENSFALVRLLNVLVPEVTASSPSMEFGIAGVDPGEVGDAAADVKGIINTQTETNTIAGGQLTYTFAGADFEEFEGEMIFQILIAYGQD